MPQLIGVEEDTHNGEEGFTHKYEVITVHEFAAEKKARVAAASRYPLKAVGTDVVGSELIEGGAMEEWHIEVFVPKAGMRQNNAIEKARDLVTQF